MKFANEKEKATNFDEAIKYFEKANDVSIRALPSHGPSSQLIINIIFPPPCNHGHHEEHRQPQLHNHPYHHHQHHHHHHHHLIC
jgi:hypothetical protein